MMKAAIRSLCLIVVLGTASQLPAQTTPADVAAGTAARRTYLRTELREILAKAAIAEQRRDYAGAATLYDEAWRRVEEIGPSVEIEAQQTVEGLTAVRMKMAHDALRRGDLRSAETNVKDVLHVNPRDPQAIELERQVHAEIERPRPLH